MLFYLASHPDPVSRSDLIMLFWPDENEQAGRRHLREALSKLRAQLDDDRYWQVDQDRVGLDHAHVSVDVDDFQQMVENDWHVLRQTPHNVPLPLPAAERVRAALELWRAGRFLAGSNVHSSEAFDYWLTSFTHQLENVRLVLLERLADHCAASGDLHTAIFWMNQALDCDELNETYSLRLLAWMRALGLRSEAMRLCARMEGVYARETGGSPPEALRTACRQARGDSPASIDGARAWPLPMRMQAPFVGRIYAMQHLHKLLQRGGAAIVLGEAGAGKTRLVQNFTETSETPLRLLLAQGRVGENSLPFQPLIEMLRRDVQPAEWRRVDPVWRAALVPILPELLPGLPARIVSHETAEHSGRSRIFEALRQVLLALNGSARVLLFLDDAQWSDEATLSALAYIYERRYFHERGLLVLAARQGERSLYLEQFLAHPGIEQALRLTLRQLSEEEIGLLARSVLNQELPAGLVERLVRDTGGNPLFILETLRGWLELSPRPPLESLAELPLPVSIYNLLHERLRALDSRGRQVLQAAAVIGQSFPVDVLEVVTALPPERVMQALEDLERYYLVRPDTALPARYAFIHDRFREVLLRELSPARRRLLHQRTAVALQDRLSAPAGPQAALLAGHFEAAGDAHAAFGYWLQAASYAIGLYSYSEAFDAFMHAEALLPQLAAGLDDGSLYALYSNWSDTAYVAGDVDGMEHANAALRAFGEQRASPFLVGAGLSGMAYAAVMRGDFTTAMADLDLALPYLKQHGDPYEEILGFTRYGTLLIHQMRFDEARKPLEHALSLGEGAVEERVLSVWLLAMDWMALLEMLSGWPERALALCQEGTSQRQVRLLKRGATHSLFAHCAALLFTGRLRESLDLIQSSMDQMHHARTVRDAGTVHYIAATAHLLLGELDAAWTHAHKAIELAQRASFTDLLYGARCVLADLLALAGTEEALTAYRLALPPRKNGLVYSLAAARIGYLTALSGDIENGAQFQAQMVEYCQQAGFWLAGINAQIGQAGVLAIRGQHAAARALLVQWSATAREHSMQTAVLESEILLGEVLLQQGEWVAALQQGQTVARRSSELRMRPMMLRGLLLQARALHANGQGVAPDMRDKVLALLAEWEPHARLPETAGIFAVCRKEALKFLD